MAYFEATTIKNSAGTAVNPAENEHIILLRRIVKLLESNAVADSSGRQRVAVEPGVTAISAAITGWNINNTNQVGSLAAGTAVIGYANMGYQGIQETARNAYANGIRSKLTFS